MSSLTPFHLAIPVQDLETARAFYRDVLNCPEGRSSDKWVDFNLYGHQFVIHETDGKVREVSQTFLALLQIGNWK